MIATVITFFLNLFVKIINVDSIVGSNIHRDQIKLRLAVKN